MNLHELQNEINKLLFHYYNTIGLIQRDCINENVDELLEALRKDLKDCKTRLDSMLDDGNNEVELLSDLQEIIRESENFIEDGKYIIDKIVNRK